MTTPSDRPEKWLPVAPMDGCTFSGYQASDQGRYRSVDRVVKGRSYQGKLLASRKDPDGYVLIDMRCDSTDPAHNRRHTLLGHRVVLTTFDRPCPPGMETCHSERGPAFNWWPEGIRWDTKVANHRDMVEAGTAVMPEPSYPCRNAPTCINMVKTKGRRCLSCVQQVGLEAAAMFRAGKWLDEVAEHFGNSPDWVFRLAVEHGGFEGSKADVRAVPHTPCQCAACLAATQRARGPLARLTATFRSRSRSATR